jgi:uncharacterized membrane protein
MAPFKSVFIRNERIIRFVLEVLMLGIVNRLRKLTLLCCVFCSCLAASAQCKFTTLNIPGAIDATAEGVNDQGAIVGAVLDSQGGHGFLFFQGKVTRFRFPGSSGTNASGINNHGQIVGDYTNGSSSKAGQFGFVVHNGVFQSISAPGAPAATRALGINNLGAIVGTAGPNGFLLNGGHFTTIRFPGSTLTEAFGINDFGVIVGIYFDAKNFTHGFKLQSGKYTAIDFPGASNTGVTRIDNEGIWWAPTMSMVATSTDSHSTRAAS